MSANKKKRFLLVVSVIGLALCPALAGVVIVVPVAWAEPGQAPTEGLHIPELDAGFHLLYELKPSEARARFEA